MSNAFASKFEVGDMLAQGVNIEPEQEQLQEAPGGRPMLAVWGMPDPMLESGQPWYIDGMPVVIPVIMENCLPSEQIAGYSREPDTLGNYVRNDPWPWPVRLGENHPDTGVYAMWTGEQVDDEHVAKPLWDLWPVEQESIRSYNNAVEKAIYDSGYLHLVDYFNWENGNYEPENSKEMEETEARVLDDKGELKHPDEFKFELWLPPEHKYTWEKLLDVSQQGWQSYGMTLPDKHERSRFFYPNGAIPWY